EQDRVDPEDSRRGQLLPGGRPAFLRGVPGGRNRRPQGRRGGPDHGLRQVLRAEARGPRGHQPADEGEDEHRRLQGAEVHRRQRSQRSDPV
ncbi:MAG: DNA-binding protein HBsu, partial [uncultured Rubrobacteraceae bacterium]